MLVYLFLIKIGGGGGGAIVWGQGQRAVLAVNLLTFYLLGLLGCLGLTLAYSLLKFNINPCSLGLFRLVCPGLLLIWLVWLAMLELQLFFS